jgi:hypothetical protein
MGNRTGEPSPSPSVQALAEHAGLELSPERLREVGPIVQAWREGCLVLNLLMSGPEYDRVLPITILSHAPERKPDPRTTRG